jgi:DNA excision repair protein ERCC-2
LPRWINQYIIEAHSNMSTDMAISLAKKFIRQISQPWDHTQTGISLWTLDDIEAKQQRDQEESARAIQEHGEAFGTTLPPHQGSASRDGEDGGDGGFLDGADVEMGDEFGMDDEALAAMEMPEGK